jgi:hypothetical protein
MSTPGTFEVSTPLHGAGPATVDNTSVTHAASSAPHASGVPVGDVVLGERGQHRGPRA